MIVSASRRCDIPAHYMDWMMSRVAAGFCLSRNPFNPRLAARVDLVPPGLTCLVFWTRDPGSLAARARELAAFRAPFFAQVTITGLPRALEPGVPERAGAIDGFRALADAIGPRLAVWRFDPVFVSRGLDADSRRRDFESLAAALEGRTNRVVVSLLDEYSGTRARLERALFPGAVFARPRGEGGPAEGGNSGDGPSGAGAADDSPVGAIFGAMGGTESGAMRDTISGALRGTINGSLRGTGSRGLPAPPEPYPSLLADLAAIAASRGMEMSSCAEGFDLLPYGIRPGACVDPELVSLAIGAPFAGAADPGQRRHCSCARSVDIGAYGSCPAGCVYCYASRGGGRLLRPRAEDESLAPPPGRAGGSDPGGRAEHGRAAGGAAQSAGGSAAPLP